MRIERLSYSPDGVHGGNVNFLLSFGAYENDAGANGHSGFRSRVRDLHARFRRAYVAHGPCVQRIGISQGVCIQLTAFQKSIIITVRDEDSREVLTRVVPHPLRFDQL